LPKFGKKHPLMTVKIWRSLNSGHAMVLKTVNITTCKRTSPLAHC
jgi:hypothetical protein